MANIKKKSGLGKGLDNLIPEIIAKEKAPAEVITIKEKVPSDVMIKISEIEPNRDQPRKMFQEEALQELADSIKQYGVIQPLIVQKKDGYYEIIAGERRWRAAKLAGVKEVPVIIKEYSDEQIMEIALIENIQREDLNPIEEAKAYKRLIDEHNLKQEEVADKVSKSRAAITNTMRLLKLSPDVQNMVIDGMISSGHARALLSIDSKTEQLKLATRIYDDNLSVRETENLVKQYLNPKQPKKVKNVEKDELIYKNIENVMKDSLGTKVTINRKENGRGRIEIEYYSIAEFDRITSMITRLSEK